MSWNCWGLHPARLAPTCSAPPLPKNPATASFFTRVHRTRCSVWQRLTQKHIKRPGKLNRLLIFNSKESLKWPNVCFLFQIIKLLPGNGTAPRVDCTYVVSVWGPSLQNFRHCSSDSKWSAAATRNITLQLWKSAHSGQILGIFSVLCNFLHRQTS